MHLTRVENSDTKRVSLFWHTLYMKFVFFRFWRTEKIDWVMKEQMGAMPPPQNFWARTATGNRVRNSRSRSSKVIAFGTDRKCVCNFLLVININVGPILCHFRDIAGFLLSRAIPPLFHTNVEGVPIGLDCRCCGCEERRP